MFCDPWKLCVRAEFPTSGQLLLHVNTTGRNEIHELRSLAATWRGRLCSIFTLTCQDKSDACAATTAVDFLLGLPLIHKKQVTSVTRLANKFPKNGVRTIEPGWPKTLRFYGGSVLPCAQLDAFASERLAMEMHRFDYQIIQVTCRLMCSFWVILN